MPRATDEQCQRFAERQRDRANLAHRLYLCAANDISQYADVYEHLNDNPTWTDSNSNNAPHTMTPADGLATHTFFYELEEFMRTHPQWNIIKSLPINPLES